ncbi:carboxylate-amine ligase [Tundrisphaera lichenicola]|uniref:carboxylate-amine ligase n=1 Tax=Tundrisphaera lichenicola TaxID=2029860 RepID=UPI003EBFBBDA
MASPNNFTIGVEEEYQIVDPGSRQLRQRAGRVLPEARRSVGDEVTNELYLSQIEIGTQICRSLAEVRAELIRLRGAVIQAAAHSGCRIVSAGTHPFSRWENQTITPKDRYDTILQEFQQITREQIIFGCHVHVGIEDREQAIHVMNQARPWLPVLLALSANSPFWQGRDTGYASYRTELFGRFPMTGIPADFASRAEFDEVIRTLIAMETIEDGSKIYWDIRPSTHFETLEFRIADVCPTVDEAVMIAGLCRALAIASLDDSTPELPSMGHRPEILRASKWRAARFGLEGDLIEPHELKAVPARRVVHAFLEFLRPTLDQLGDWEEISGLVGNVLDRGNGAARQRRVFLNSGRHEDVVDFLIIETSRDVG